MTTTLTHDGNDAPARGGAPLRALGAGAAVVAVLAAVAVGSGALPEGTTRYVLLGCGIALAAAAVATAFHAKFAARTAQLDARLQAGRLQTLLALGFAAKLVALCCGFGALWLAGVKFTDLFAFALAFAAASLICQAATAFVMARALRRPPARS